MNFRKFFVVGRWDLLITNMFFLFVKATGVGSSFKDFYSTKSTGIWIVHLFY